MVPLALRDVADACGGRLVGADPDAVVRDVVTDSRAAGPGSLFVALAGEQADGHAFVGDAVARGAVAALVSEDVEAPAVRVDDPLAALGRIAGSVRARLNAQTIAITGSSGKTCTKEFIAAATATRKRTVASRASYNNEIGVPLTILGADEETEVLVVEVGSRGIGHIASLMPVVRPDVSVVTNVGPAHLGMFGSIENTARAKSELVQGLGPDGVAILNADDPAVRAMAEHAKSVVTFGRRTDADVRAIDVSLDADARASFTIVAGDERAEVHLRLPGEHMVANALAAAAAARAAGISLADAARGLAGCEGPAWRMQVNDTPAGRRILNDAYNANPDSMLAALKALVTMGVGRPTWAVLGHMAELGDQATAEHDRIGRLAVRLGVARLLTVGEDARAIHEAARLEGMFGGEAVFAPAIDDALAVLRAELEPNAVVLVKASRAAGLERLAAALEGMP